MKKACVQTEFDLSTIQMEVEGEENVPTGRFRRKRLNPSNKPAGNWPDHWIDSIHEAAGHSIDSLAADRGEKSYSTTASALCTRKQASNTQLMM